MGVCFWLDSSISVHTSVRRSVLQPISRIRVLGQKSRISVFHWGNKHKGFWDFGPIHGFMEAEEILWKIVWPSLGCRPQCRGDWCQSRARRRLSRCSTAVSHCRSRGNLEETECGGKNVKLLECLLFSSSWLYSSHMCNRKYANNGETNTKNRDALCMFDVKLVEKKHVFTIQRCSDLLVTS